MFILPNSYFFEAVKFPLLFCYCLDFLQNAWSTYWFSQLDMLIIIVQKKDLPTSLLAYLHSGKAQKIRIQLDIYSLRTYCIIFIIFILYSNAFFFWISKTIWFLLEMWNQHSRPLYFNKGINGEYFIFLSHNGWCSRDRMNMRKRDPWTQVCANKNPYRRLLSPHFLFTKAFPFVRFGELLTGQSESKANFKENRINNFLNSCNSAWGSNYSLFGNSPVSYYHRNLQTCNHTGTH